MSSRKTGRQPRDYYLAGRFSVTILTLITAIFFAIGWVAGRLWLGSVYCGFAVRQGWREGTKPRTPAPPRESSLYG